MNAAPYAATVAASVRQNAVEQAMPMTPRVRAPTAVTMKAATTWSSSMPPNRNTRLKIGTDSSKSKRTNDIEASSLPQRIEKEGKLLASMSFVLLLLLL